MRRASCCFSAPQTIRCRAFDLIRAWGFDYKTVAFYWVELNSAAKHDADFFTGLGYWTRANPEQCLLATGGKPMRRAKDVRRLVIEKRREHSRKPDRVRERIERLVSGPYLELFGRETKPGWHYAGETASRTVIVTATFYRLLNACKGFPELVQPRRR